MAVDSTNKRASAIQSIPHVFGPVADGTIDDLDRMQVTWLYAGIAPGTIQIVEEEEDEPTPTVAPTGGAPLGIDRWMTKQPEAAIPAWVLEEEEVFLILV